jgi:hypothetical protein
MARKQTLKSLLGGNDSRVEVDLNLDEQVFQAPTVRAGNYSVAAPVYAKTNALSQLSDSLERYAGPILRGYANIKEQQSIAMADATELLTPEQLQLLDAGDSSGLVQSINETEDKLDEAQRKKLISFAENPNNYSRAYKRVGSRVAGVFSEDYLTNMEKYAEDESFDFQTKADELAEKYGLNGLGEQEFYKQINNISESTKARFGELKNAHMVREHKAETVSDQVQKSVNGTWSAEDWEEATKAGTVAQNQDILLGMVTQLREKNPAKADKLIELYGEGGIKIGNGGINEEFEDELQNARANEDRRLSLIADVVEGKRNDSIAEFQAVYSNAITLGQEIPESTDIFINDGLTITVDTSNAKNAADVANAVSDAINKIPENDKTISNGTKALIINKFAGEVEKQKLKVVQQRESAGVNVASSQFMDLLAVKDSEGNYIYGEGSETTLGRASQTQEWVEELNPIIDAIYADPELDISQKVQQSKMATLRFVAEKKATHDQFVKEKEDAIKSVEFEKDTGGDQEKFYVADLFTQVAAADGDLEAMRQRPEIVATAREFNAETERLRDDILNRSMTDEEIASGMTSAEFTQKKLSEGEALNVDRRALYQQDYGNDEKIDGITSEEQMPENALKKQEEITNDEKPVNVKINTNGVTGFADQKLNGIKKQDPTWVKGNNVKNFIQDITTPRGEGHIFNQGIKDSYNTAYMVAQINDPNVKSMHEAHKHNALAYQSGEEMGLTPFQRLRDVDEVGPQMVANYIQGETTIRAVQEGKAGMTLDELAFQSIDGVRFDATLLNQSATPIVPYTLINKALTNQDMSPTEEATLRDYADLLYDSSELDEAGKTVVLQKMIELQVNAYAQLGFRFSK